MKVGQKPFEMYGEDHPMDTAPVIRDGRVYAPLRFVADAFGVKVKWDGKNQTVHLERAKKK